MKHILFVFLGGGIGSSCRYLVGMAVNNAKNFLPYGTLLANVLGSFFIGILLAYFVNVDNENQLRLLTIVGFCGGFTTMSAFSAESILLLQQGKQLQFFLYVFVTLLLCLGATVLGMTLFKA